MNAYEYKPLPPDGSAIRLLTLFPGKPPDPLRLCLFQRRFSRVKRPKYEALSYTWGDQTDPGTVEVQCVQTTTRKSKRTKTNKSNKDIQEYETFTLEVGRNLAAALLHLRRQDCSRRLWIDAICINQRDFEERSREVLKMGDIFNLAHRVMVWLGPTSEDSSHAIETLSYLGRQVYWNIQDYAYADADEAQERGWGNPHVDLPYTQPTWNSIASLLDREWFKRIWVWQEIAMANESARVICGLDEILWTELRSAIETLYYKLSTPLSKQDSTRENLSRALHIASILNSDQMISHLARGRNSFCANPRDRIYAVMSVSEDTKKLKIRPDYNKSKQEVFLEFVLGYANEHEDLYFLHHCENQSFGNYPSWVPQWSNPSPYRAYLYSDVAPWKGQSHYLGDGKLQVHGLYCGVIASDCKSAALTSTQEEVLSLISSWEPEDLPTAEYPTGESLLDAFITILCDGFLEPRFIRYGYPDLSQVKEHYRKSGGLGKGGRGRLDDPAMRRFYDDLNQFVPGRKLFHTKEGYIGLGPSQAMPGDHLYAIIGCRAMLILRPTEPGRHVVVGHCNLHGFVDLTAFLRKLPEDWYVEDGDFYRYLWKKNFVNSKTGEKSRRDPRLLGDPPGWTFELGDDGDAYWRNVESGKVVNEDPRVSDVGFLRDRGVDVKEIILV